MRALLVLATLAVWGLAMAYWPLLPNEIPMHFGITGDPDRFADKSIVSWFWLPTLATVFAITFGLLMPGWLRGRCRIVPLPARLRRRKVMLLAGPLDQLSFALAISFRPMCCFAHAVDNDWKPCWLSHYCRTWVG